MIVTSPLSKGEVQDASVPNGIQAIKSACAVSLGERNKARTWGHQGWLEIERQEGSATLSRDHWFGQKLEKGDLSGAIRMPSRASSKPVDRAFVVARKRVTTVEQRDAGKVEA